MSGIEGYARCPGSGSTILGYRHGQKRSTCPACMQMVGIDIGPDVERRADHDRPVNADALVFQRFGNAFVAVSRDGTLYVVSLYLGAWAVHYRSPAMDEPARVGMYGLDTPENASQSAQEHHYAQKVINRR